MKALSANNYAAATAHFDPAMKASFSPERIGSIWRHVTEADGRLISWGVSQRTTADCRETIVASLKFDHRSNLAAFISVNPNGEVSGLYFAPTPISATPATSPPPAVVRNFDSIDVNVGSLEQCGTITIPTTGSGPWPAVVLVGSADKDGTAGAKHFFKDIAEGLSSRGIIVLRYDRRWYDIFDKRDRQDLTVEKDYIDDGAAAVNLLRSRGEVAKDRIFVAGYDLAGAITPDVAREVAPVQGLILLAPAFAGRKVGASEVRSRHYLGWDSHPQLRNFDRKAKELDSHRMPATENFGLYPASYWYDLVGRNEVTVARRLHIPILILHGGHDFTVIDIEHWQEGLKGVPHVRVETIPALSDMLLAGIAKPRAKHYDPGHIDQQVIDAMAAFIEKPLANRTATASY
jgi:alpha-beta hydrolase superfamily lysophospholipase